MKTILINVHNEYCKHFWHFMMGELMPIISIIQNTKASNIYLYNPKRKWGKAFDRFYMDICDNDTVTIEFINDKLNIKKSINQYNIKDDRWDWAWDTKDKKRFTQAVNWLTKETLKYMNSKYKHTSVDCLIQIRKDIPSLTKYFRDDYPNIQNTVMDVTTYGAARRNIKDFHKIKNELKKHNVSSTLITHDGIHLYKQIYHYINKKSLWLEHGAGMFFSVFMKDKSNIVEVIPASKANEFNGAAQGLARLGILKNFHIERIIIENGKSIYTVMIENFISNIYLKLLTNDF